ncbi:hypothetical protein LCGC14_2015390 [marine sediment metagenome]|uniref:Uncharacterized protein n=1 Tax=marine sediment metagenome TaxID=412755 RepID=A0A0F9FLK3_9ZZZZ|nr:hypothetical protein [Candidatus Scalindua sp.]
MTIIGGIEIPEKGVKVIHEPGKVINILCDLPNSSDLLHMLEIFKEDGRAGKMLYRHAKVKMYMLLLFKHPAWMSPDEEPNPTGLILFVASSLEAFIKYFYIWFNNEKDNDRMNIIFEIQDMLYEHQKIDKTLEPQL